MRPPRRLSNSNRTCLLNYAGRQPHPAISDSPANYFHYTGPEPEPRCQILGVRSAGPILTWPAPICDGTANGSGARTVFAPGTTHASGSGFESAGWWGLRVSRNQIVTDSDDRALSSRRGVEVRARRIVAGSACGRTGGKLGSGYSCTQESSHQTYQITGKQNNAGGRRPNEDGRAAKHRG